MDSNEVRRIFCIMAHVVSMAFFVLPNAVCAKRIAYRLFIVSNVSVHKDGGRIFFEP